MDERKYPHPMPGDGLRDSITELAEDTARLVRLEIALFKQEITELVKRNAVAVGMLLGAGVTAFLFLIFLQVLVIILVPMHWIPALAFALTWLAATVILALWGKSRLKIAGPEATIQTLKDDLEWVKQQLRPAPK